MGRARGANAKMAGAFEVTYGTPPGSGYTRLPFVSSMLGEEQGLIPGDLLGFGREPQDPTPDVINNDGDVVVPVDLRHFGYWLKLFLGAPVTTGAGPYTHTFKSGLVALPSMSIEVGLPEVPSFGMNFGVRGDRMRIALSRRGLLNATLGLIAQGEALETSTDAGTPAELELERFAQATGSILRDGVELGSITAAEFTFSNGYEKVEAIRDDGRIEDADPGQIGLSGSITARFANTVLLTQAAGHSDCELEFGWSLGAGKTLTFTVPRVFLPRPKRPVDGPGGVQVTFAWQAARDGTLGAGLQAVLVNDVAAYA